MQVLLIPVCAVMPLQRSICSFGWGSPLYLIRQQDSISSLLTSAVLQHPSLQSKPKASTQEMKKSPTAVIPNLSYFLLPALLAEPSLCDEPVAEDRCRHGWPHTHIPESVTVLVEDG